MWGMGVPRAWHTISVPVVLEKSTWFGGSWINTGPDVSDWPRTEMVRKMNVLNYYHLYDSKHSSVIIHSSPIILPIISCSPAIRSSRICRGLAMTASAVRARGRVVSISSNHTLFCDIAWKWIKCVCVTYCVATLCLLSRRIPNRDGHQWRDICDAWSWTNLSPSLSWQTRWSETGFRSLICNYNLEPACTEGWK